MTRYVRQAVDVEVDRSNYHGPHVFSIRKFLDEHYVPEPPKTLELKGEGFRIRCASIEWQGTRNGVKPRGWEMPVWLVWVLAIASSVAIWVTGFIAAVKGLVRP